jgi:hypothetical protein
VGLSRSIDCAGAKPDSAERLHALDAANSIRLFSGIATIRQLYESTVDSPRPVLSIDTFSSF